MLQVTEVRIEVAPKRPGFRLLACFSLVFDRCLVVHGIKLIDGNNGPFVSMPSEAAKSRCPQCSKKNYLHTNYCGHCGVELPPNRRQEWIDKGGRDTLYLDVVHPVYAPLREHIKKVCLDSYEEEVAKPGSVLPLRYNAADKKSD